MLDLSGSSTCAATPGSRHALAHACPGARACAWQARRVGACAGQCSPALVTWTLPESGVHVTATSCASSLGSTGRTRTTTCACAHAHARGVSQGQLPSVPPPAPHDAHLHRAAHCRAGRASAVSTGRMGLAHGRSTGGGGAGARVPRGVRSAHGWPAASCLESLCALYLPQCAIAARLQVCVWNASRQGLPTTIAARCTTPLRAYKRPVGSSAVCVLWRRHWGQLAVGCVRPSSAAIAAPLRAIIGAPTPSTVAAAHGPLSSCALAQARTQWQGALAVAACLACLAELLSVYCAPAPMVPNTSPIYRAGRTIHERRSAPQPMP